MAKAHILASATTLRKTVGSYLAVFDVMSLANRPGKCDEMMTHAKQCSAGESSKTIFRFNDCLAHLADDKEMLSWTFPLDGIFRIQLNLVSEGHEIQSLPGQKGQFIGQEGPYGLLSCGSGRLLVDSLVNLGAPWLQPTMTIAPGLYRVLMVENDEEQLKHELLTDPGEYPDTDGPDWILYLHRLAN